MATRDEEVFGTFVRIWSAWWSGVPAVLARQEPSVVARLLNLGLLEEGISQSDLRRELGVNQPRLSKLMKKLVRAGWIRVRRPKTDSRLKLMTTTAAGREKIMGLKADLAALLPEKEAVQASAPLRKSRLSSVRRRIEQQQGQQGFVLDE